MSTILIDTNNTQQITEASKKKLLEEAHENGQVIMHCLHYGCSSECGTTFRCKILIHPGIQLIPIEGTKPAILLHSYNINLSPGINYKKTYRTDFTLVFSALPKNCTEFDFIEPDETGRGWVSKNIKRNKTDVYKLHITRDSIWEGDVEI